MVKTLPEPEVLRCFFDDSFRPRLPAMCLRWHADSGPVAERLWELPDGVCLAGPPPVRFGVSIQRRAADSYSVRLLWNHTGLTWTALTRVELLTSALAPLLAALGTDLWHLLDQPISAEASLPRKAA
jgi:hypothetical protein